MLHPLTQLCILPSPWDEARLHPPHGHPSSTQQKAHQSNAITVTTASSHLLGEVYLLTILHSFRQVKGKTASDQFLLPLYWHGRCQCEKTHLLIKQTAGLRFASKEGEIGCTDLPRFKHNQLIPKTLARKWKQPQTALSSFSFPLPRILISVIIFIITWNMTKSVIPTIPHGRRRELASRRHKRRWMPHLARRTSLVGETAMGPVQRGPERRRGRGRGRRDWKEIVNGTTSRRLFFRMELITLRRRKMD